MLLPMYPKPHKYSSNKEMSINVQFASLTTVTCAILQSVCLSVSPCYIC